MGWLDRFRASKEPESDSQPPGEPVSNSAERAAPGIEALFSGLSEDGRHSILDMGPAVGANFQLYRRFARQVRFSDLLVDPPRGSSLSRFLDSLAPPQTRTFDLVLLWNLLDLLNPEDRTRLIHRIHEITGSGARVYVLVDASETGTTRPFRFTLLGLDRVLQEPSGPLRSNSSPLLPAEVERLLRPFEVFHAFTLRGGLREYMGVKEGKAMRRSAWRSV